MTVSRPFRAQMEKFSILDLAITCLALETSNWLKNVLTNSGGVTVSYFEWVQDLGRLFWDREEIRARLAEKLADAFDRVWLLSGERSITLRGAALVAGIREVAAALEARGIYP